MNLQFSKMGRHFFPCFWFPTVLERGTKKKKNAIFVFVFDVPIGTTLLCKLCNPSHTLAAVE